MKFDWKAAAALVIVVTASTVAHAQDNAASSGVTHVFFDWGKAEVNQDGAATLDAIAARLSQSGSASIAVVGHSDRSGGAASNRQSALHRAEAVRDYLVAHGVAAGSMRVSSQGEDQPLIPTADGVREPQNRRVDISTGN